jgi:hypothetical protein
LFGRERTRNFEGVTHVVVQEPLNERHKRLLSRHRAVQIDQIDPPSAGFDWLTPWAPTIEQLLITDLSITDISALPHFVNLTHLTLYGGALKGRKNRVAISDLSALREFAGNWYDVLDDIFASTTVETLHLDNPPPDIFQRVAGMAALTSLDIRPARKLHEIPRLDQPAKLTQLKIGLAKLDNIDGLSDYRHLKSLEFDTVKGLRDLTALRAMPHLRRLYLENCGDIETLSFLADVHVEELYLVGNTNIIDGDLRSIGTNLRKASFPQRPHYNAKPVHLT